MSLVCTSKRNQRGFSLVEVLVSMLIIMFGLLGIAGMQLMALNNTEAARYSSIASVMAGDLGARMLGNTNYWGTPPASVAIAASNGVLQLTGGPPASSTDCVANACAPAVMAYFDLAQWGTNLITSLPGGKATLSCNSGETPAVCTVTISWAEKNIGLFNPTGSESTATGLATGTTATRSFQTLISVL